MEIAIKILSSYVGRDKILRTIGYGTLYLSSCTEGLLSDRLKIISNDFSYCRVILRLLDDLPMLKYTLSYGWGKQEPDVFSRILGVLNNLLDQLYYPFEHIAWAIDKRMIKGSSMSWWTMGSAIWAASLYLNIIRSLRSIFVLNKKARKIKNMKEQEVLVNQQLEQFLAIVKSSADMAIAIHYLPKGFMWAGKLKINDIALYGLISSFLGLLILARNIK